MELVIHKEGYGRITRFYLEKTEHGKDYVIGYKDGSLYQQEINPLEPVDYVPLLEMPSRIAEEFIELIMKFAGTHGIQTENENLLKGKLEATERHLNDLRAQFSAVLEDLLYKKDKPKAE